jgi:hypothetical protein
LGKRREIAGCGFGGGRGTLDVPGLFHVHGVKAREHVAEQYTIDFKSGREPPHVVESSRVKPAFDRLSSTVIQREFMVAPDPTDISFPEHVDRFSEALAGLEDIAQRQQAIDAVLAANRNGRCEPSDVFVNISQESDPHRADSVASVHAVRPERRYPEITKAHSW